jgi:hypothetical protein
MGRRETELGAVQGIGLFRSVPCPVSSGAGSAAGCSHPFACPRPGPGRMGRSASEKRSGGVNQGGARAARTGGADRTATSRLAAGQEGCHAAGSGDPAGACGRQRICPSRRP